jgi:hypothetical protein
MRTAFLFAPAARGAWLVALAVAQVVLCAVPPPIATFAGRVPVQPGAAGTQGPVEEHHHHDDGQRTARAVVAPRPRGPDPVVREHTARPTAPRATRAAAARVAVAPPLPHGTIPVPLRC